MYGFHVNYVERLHNFYENFEKRPVICGCGLKPIEMSCID